MIRENPKVLRAWIIKAESSLNERGVLFALQEPPPSQRRWMSTHGFTRKSEFQASPQYREFAEAKQKYVAASRKAYDMLTAMPGVVNTPHIAELCFEKFREKRKGRELWLELLEPTPPRQNISDEDGHPREWLE